jgi:transposase
MTDEAIAERAGMRRRGVEELWQWFVEKGFEATLEGKPHGHRARAIQGEDKARLIVLACSPAPEGHDHWSLRLLQEKRVTPEGNTVSHETIRQALKKTHLKLWQKREWCIPPEGNAGFVAGMEDIPDVCIPGRRMKRIRWYAWMNVRNS